MARVLALLLLTTTLTAQNAPHSTTPASKPAPGRITTYAAGLEHPWALAFLPDGRLLVTERPGRVRIVDKTGRLSQPLGGVPRVYARGQGGLLDVARSEEHTSELQSLRHLVCRLLLEKKNNNYISWPPFYEEK